MAIIPTSFYKSTGKMFGKFAQTKVMLKQYEQKATEPAKFAAAMLVTSIVSKDLVGCYYYTTQSLHNKKIPEEKRKFVAALDLMNGIIMVGGQFLIGKVIDRGLTPKWLAKYTGTVKNKDTGKETLKSTQSTLASDNIEMLAKKALKESEDKLKALGVDMSRVNKEEVYKGVVKRLGKGSQYYNGFGKGFGLLMTAIATTALTKRTLAPLLSTPLAGWFKNKFMDKNNKKQSDKVLDGAVNTMSTKYKTSPEKTK